MYNHLKTMNPKNSRQEIDKAVKQNRFLLIAGPCSDQLDRTITKEGERLTELSDDNLLIVHRRPVWKPRTNPESWHGLDETNPREARLQLAAASCTAAVAIEVGKVSHQMFLEHVCFAWVGARSVGNTALQELLIGNPQIPFGIKSDLNGKIEKSVAMINAVIQGRSKRVEDHNPSGLLIHRSGGVESPDAWENQIIAASARLESRRSEVSGMIVDLAHGTEIAHDPRQKGRKTIAGQVAAFDHMLDILEDNTNILPNLAGLMVEASDTKPKPGRCTDPNMPFALLEEKVDELKQILKKRRPVRSTGKNDWDHGPDRCPI